MIRKKFCKVTKSIALGLIYKTKFSILSRDLVEFLQLSGHLTFLQFVQTKTFRCLRTSVEFLKWLLSILHEEYKTLLKF